MRWNVTITFLIFHPVAETSICMSNINPYIYTQYRLLINKETKSPIKKPLTEAIESVSLVTSSTKCFWSSWGAFAHFSSLQITQQTPDWGQDSGLAFLKCRVSSVWTLSFSFTPVSLLCCKSRPALSYYVHHTAVQPTIRVVRSSLQKFQIWPRTPVPATRYPFSHIQNPDSKVLSNTQNYYLLTRH